MKPGFTIGQLHDIKLMALREAEGVIERDLRQRSCEMRRAMQPDVAMHEMRTGMAMDSGEIAISAAKQIEHHYGRAK